MTPEQRLELLLDRIAEALIESQYVDSNDVADAQKFILNGQLQQGAGSGVLALFQKDIRANEEDLQLTLVMGEHMLEVYQLQNIYLVKTIL